MSPIASSSRPAIRAAFVATFCCMATHAQAQAPSHAPEAAPSQTATPAATAPYRPADANDKAGANPERQADAGDAGPLVPLAWLEGCWQGTVNQREFREQWMPLRDGILIGTGQQVLRNSLQDYEFLRLEARPDGVYFTQFSGDRTDASFKLASTTTDDKDTIFTFANTVDAFPSRLIYRRGTGGWLYETIEGSPDGADKKVIYPLRRINCESGELILK
ncbi:MAG: DUF6265 family protein [Casimicrobiaceae bacterium]